MVLFHQVSPIENILPLGQLIAWAYSSRVTPRNTLDIAYYLNNIYLFFSALYDFKKFLNRKLPQCLSAETRPALATSMGITSRMARDGGCYVSRFFRKKLGYTAPGLV